MSYSYVRQKRKNESGPVALINLAKKLDLRFGYRQYIKLFRKLCVCESKADGTRSADFDNVIRSVFNWMGDVDMHVNPTPPQLMKAVDEGKGIVLKIGDRYVGVHCHWHGNGNLCLSNYIANPRNHSPSDTLSTVGKNEVNNILQKGVTMWTVKSNL